MNSFLKILLLSAILALALSPASGNYEERVKTWEKEFLTDKEFCNKAAKPKEMLDKATKKKYPSDLKTGDQLAAGRVVNLYTQATGGGCFYRNLNSQLRAGKVSKMYADYAKLLNDAIDMLGSTLNKGQGHTLYRGTGKCDEISKVGRATLKGFTSTSVDPTVPLSFSCGMYMIFKNAEGLDISHLAAETGHEKEFLLKSDYTVNVKKFITDKTEIDKELKPHLKSAAHRSKIKTVIVAEG